MGSEKKIILFNAVHDPSLSTANHDDGTDKKDDRTLAESSTDNDDKITAMKRALKFPLAVFLIVVEPCAFFSYHSSVDADPKKHEIVDNNLFHYLKRPLGGPLGPPLREGYIFMRSFQHVSVSVNVILWKQSWIGKQSKDEENISWRRETWSLFQG